MAVPASTTSYPFYGYEYDEAGYHHGGLVIEDRARLDWYRDHVVKPAMHDGREVIITDGDDYAIFHTKDGVLLFVGDGSGVYG